MRRRGITGNKELLKASGAYPPRFGVAVIQAWEAAGPVPAALEQAAANTEWALASEHTEQTTMQPSRGESGRKTPKKKTSPWAAQNTPVSHEPAMKKTRRSGLWDTEQPATKEEPKAISKPGPWGAEQGAHEHRAWGTRDGPGQAELEKAKTTKQGPWGAAHNFEETEVEPKATVQESLEPSRAKARRRGPWG